MGAGDSEGKVDSAIGRVKRHVTDVRDLVTIVAGVVLAAAQTVATANWGAVVPYAVAVAIVGAAVVIVYLRSGRGRPPPVLPPPAGAAFRGLLPFEEEDRSQFYGREVEAGALHQMVAYSEFRFGVLTGESGCGKTSLLLAGLMPRLRDGPYLPVYARVSTDPEAGIRRAAALASGTASRPGEPLPAYLGRVAAASGKTVVLLCDQFEQFWIQVPTRAGRQPFIETLAACHHTSALPLKILLVLREDALFRMIDFDGYVPEPLAMGRRYHLRNFDEDQARDVIDRSAREARLPFDPGLAALVARDLAVHDVVLPTELQIVCQRLQSERLFTVERYRAAGGKGKLVDAHLRDVVRATGDPEGAQLVLVSLIAEGDGRRALSAGEIAPRAHRSVAVVETILATLVRARLVRELGDGGPARHELMHDYLIEKVQAVAGKAIGAARMANLTFRYWLTRHDIDRRTRMPLRDWWLVRRHSDLERGSRETDLLRRSLRLGVARLAGVGAIVLVLTVGFTFAVMTFLRPVTVNIYFPAERLEKAAREIERSIDAGRLPKRPSAPEKATPPSR